MQSRASRDALQGKRSRQQSKRERYIIVKSNVVRKGFFVGKLS
jgi:hypothetical protein